MKSYTTTKQFTFNEVAAMAIIAEMTESHLNAECAKLTPEAYEYDTLTEMLFRVHTARMDGAEEAIHAALCDCVINIGEPIIDYWAKTFDKEDLEGYESVCDLLGVDSRTLQRNDAIRKMAAQTATHLKEKDSYLRASGVDKIERAGLVEAVAVLDTALADNESTIATIGKAIEAALPFCSLWYKGLLLDKFFEVATFLNSKYTD